VDDVVRYIGPALNYSLASLEAGIPHFFRLAVSTPSMIRVLDVDFTCWERIQFADNGASGDFTMPATLYPNGTWVDPQPGAT
jgi:hypothetical protein